MPDKFLTALLELSPSKAAVFALVVADCVCMGSCVVLYLWPAVLDRGVFTVAFLGVITSAPVVALYAAIMAFCFRFGKFSDAAAAARAGGIAADAVPTMSAGALGGAQEEWEPGAAILSASFLHLILNLSSIAVTAIYGLDRLAPEYAVPRIWTFAFMSFFHVLAVFSFILTKRQQSFLISLCLALMLAFFFRLFNHTQYGMPL